MSQQSFRTPDEQAMVDAAHQRASAAYAELVAITRHAHRANATLLSQGLTPQPVGEFQPPQAPPGASAADLIRLYDGQAQWYASEGARLQALVISAEKALAKSAEPPSALAAGPRPVPLTLKIAEVARTPWRWMRWLLFPPFTMLGAMAIGLPAAASPEAAGAVLALVVVALWIYGVGVGLRRVHLLAHGEVATVLQKTESYGATRNRNVPMLRARGWTVSVESYTGMSRVTELVVQTSKGIIGRVKVSHGPTFDGVVLVDPSTGAGCANLELGSAPQPGENGQWKSTLSTRVWLTTLTAIAMTVALFVVAATIALRL